MDDELFTTIVELLDDSFHLGNTSSKAQVTQGTPAGTIGQCIAAIATT